MSELCIVIYILLCQFLIIFIFNIIHHIKANLLLDIYFISICLLHLFYAINNGSLKGKIEIILLHEFKLGYTASDAASNNIKAWGYKSELRKLHLYEVSFSLILCNNKDLL